jgi:hypothetical protein
MPSAEELAQQRRLLEKHRRNLARLEEQQASFGGEMATPLYIINGLEETREAIQRIEDDLRTSRVSRAEAVIIDRNRAAMLAKVKAIWVDGLLKNSLEQEVRIALDLVEQPSAVDLPLNVIVQELNRPPRPLPPATPMVDVFDASNGALLILGAPGAGKTTLLLELARDLLTRAEFDSTHPLPVVFNLSSWVQKRQPLTAWMVDELNIKYDVPRKLARGWVAGDAVLPLLDGLDEVQQEHRAACAETINAYRAEHGLVSLGVCSRIADYEELAVKLRLRDAIVVQPLTPHQIAGYLHQVGGPLAGLKAAIDRDTALRELAETPLMLTIMALTYRGIAVEHLEATNAPEQQRKQLFDAYLNHMFARRGLKVRYPRQDVIRWLTWLARGMQQQGQSVFLIERLQSDWLTKWSAQWQYVLVDRLGWALVLGLALGLVVALGFEPLYGLVFGLVLGLAVGLFGSSTNFSLRDQPRIRHIVTNVFISWLVVGLVVGPVFGLANGLANGLVNGLWFGLAGGLAGLLTGKPRVHPREIVVVEQLRWSWRKGWLSGLAGLVVGLLYGLVNGLVYGLVNGLTVGLVLGVVVGLVFGLVGGLEYDVVTTHVTPNQGIWRSARSGMLSGLVVGLTLGLALWLAFEPAYWLWFGPVVGLVVGLAFGGYAVLSHIALRLVLWGHGAMPLNLVPFLDHCVERIFLRKVGGGYIFVHRMLLEHFASLDSSPYTDSAPHPQPPTSTSG